MEDRWKGTSLCLRYMGACRFTRMPNSGGAADFHRSGVHGLGRLHGPGQLGHRHAGRLAVRLPADLGAADEQPDGRAAADALAPGWGWSPAATWPRPATTTIRRPVNYVLFVLCEIAIAACDLAEVLGSAIGLNLLFGIPLLWGVLITGVRRAAAAGAPALRHPQAGGVHPDAGGHHRRLLPDRDVPVQAVGRRRCRPGSCRRALSGSELYIAIGILGATVMPHNLYLHSALVQSRDDRAQPEAGLKRSCRYNLIDSAVAMNAAFFVNAAILIVAAATFYRDRPSRGRLAARRPTRCSRRCWAPRWRPSCSPWRCWRPGSPRRSPARWPARS